MKSLFCCVLGTFISCMAASAQRSVPEPTRFELHTQKLGSRIADERAVGSIATTQVTMRVTAMVVDDRAMQRMKGVRIDFEGAGVEEHVYLDEDQARTTMRDLRSIEENIPAARAATNARRQVEGTESCWLPVPPIRILCPEYYVGPDTAVFTAGVLGGTRFEFPNHRPADLAVLLGEALALIRKQ